MMETLALLFDRAFSAIGWLWRRPTVNVEIRTEHFEVQNFSIQISLTVDVENVGTDPTSITRFASVTGVAPPLGDLIRVKLELSETDRHLEPHRNRLLTFKGNADSRYPFTWHRRYVFRLSKGSNCVPYVANQDHSAIDRRQWIQGRLSTWWRRWTQRVVALWGRMF